MHAHLERGDGGASHPRDLLVREPLDVLQHEHLALLRRQVDERSFECVRLLDLLHVPVRSIGPGDRFVRRLEGSPFPGPTPPLGEAAVAQDQKQPPGKLGGFPALRQLIESPHEGILDRILGRVERAQHPSRKSRIAVAVAAHQHRVLLYIPRQHGAHARTPRSRRARTVPPRTAKSTRTAPPTAAARWSIPKTSITIGTTTPGLKTPTTTGMTAAGTPRPPLPRRVPRRLPRRTAPARLHRRSPPRRRCPPTGAGRPTRATRATIGRRSATAQ